MKIIISPAKKMKQEDVLAPTGMPVLVDKAEQLIRYLQSLSYEALKELLCCNDQIAALNFERYQKMDLRQGLSPAILAYEGIQYQYMAPHIFDDVCFNYIQQNVRILSGFYGILKPFDGVVPYRLELQAKLKTSFCKNVYDFWRDSIYRELVQHDKTVVNLASVEYSKIISKYCTPDIRFVTCTFGQWQEGKVKENGVYVKMARGEMVRFMAEQNITELEEIKTFDRLGYQYQESLSDANHYVFLQRKEETK